MASGRTIIVGGGISPVNPFTVGAIPVVVTADPPAVSDSILRQVDVAGVKAIIVGATDPESTATETFRTQGGVISSGPGEDSTRIGRAVVMTGVRSIGIGDDIQDGATSDSYMIGSVLRATAAGNVMFGQNLTNGGNAGVNIGGVNTIGAAANSVILIGSGITVPAARSFLAVISPSGIWQGDTEAGCTHLGLSILVVGGGNDPVSSVSRYIRVPNRLNSGANVAGINLTFIGGLGTGTANPGNLIFQTGDSTGGGSAGQVAATKMTINQFGVLAGSPDIAVAFATGDTFTAQTRANVVVAAARADIRVVRVNTSLTAPSLVQNTNEIGSLLVGGYDGVAVVDSSSIKFTATQDWSNTQRGCDIQIWTVQNGATAAVHRWRFSSSGSLIPFLDASYDFGTATQAPRQIHYSEDAGLRSRNQVSAAGAGLGTLTNAPHAGDPDFWKKETVNGTTVAIPCWNV